MESRRDCETVDLDCRMFETDFSNPEHWNSTYFCLWCQLSRTDFVYSIQIWVIKKRNGQQLGYLRSLGTSLISCTNGPTDYRNMWFPGRCNAFCANVHLNDMLSWKWMIAVGDQHPKRNHHSPVILEFHSGWALKLKRSKINHTW